MTVTVKKKRFDLPLNAGPELQKRKTVMAMVVKAWALLEGGNGRTVHSYLRGMANYEKREGGSQALRQELLELAERARRIANGAVTGNEDSAKSNRRGPGVEQSLGEVLDTVEADLRETGVRARRHG